MTSTPVKVKNVQGATFLVAGNSHTCAIKSDETVVCWGGRAGEGLTDSAGARPVKGLTHVRRLALGFNQSCALRKDGTVACWELDNVSVNVPGISGADEIAHTQFSRCARTGPKVRCWGGRFGAHPTDVKILEGTTALRGGTDLVCGLTEIGNVSCSDKGSDYLVTVGDSGTHVQARLLAVSGELTMNVHWHDDTDVIDTDDDHPAKRAIDALGATAPHADPEALRLAKGGLPAVPAAEEVLSCDQRTLGGTCTEYPHGTADSNAETRCTNTKSTWSASPCPRAGALGTCVIGAIGPALDRGATMVIYPSQWTKNPVDAPAMCVGGFSGKYVSAQEKPR